ncbi:hypothetical protein LMG27952_02222 [Paraburkholderia hiiakae]|uniref:PilZ domain-containing protein n=1 Tax=Paraburkholderia hiiakae TaxID=1081782 RepID=A0ABM8NJH9_9BURK|nr:PilZ domain-containing protein [Paraburkholderia hiiakae]CAD6528476.1 hypothetical protein LMG27952_02222 [Paraburkholderia hiiakae]
MARVKLSPGDVVIGKPLRFPVYAPDGSLLLAPGHVIESIEQVNTLLKRDARVDGHCVAPRPPVPDKVFGGVTTGAPTESEEALHRGIESTTAAFPRMPQGPELQLADPERSDIPVRAIWVGMLPGISLLVSSQSQSDLLRIGQLLDATALYGRYIYRFSTRVLVRDPGPVGVVHLDYPQETQRIPIRRHLRVSANLPIRLRQNDGSTAGIDGRTLDLSLSGAKVRLPRAALASGEYVSVVLSLPFENRARQINLGGKVRKVSPSGSGQLIGLEFTSVPSEVQGYLQAFIFEAYSGGIAM